MAIQNITVFCGSALGARPAYQQAADALGREIGRRGLSLIYGAGSRGLMGVVAAAARASGGQAVGINLARFTGNAKYLLEVEENIILERIQDRKLQLIERGDACIALPGGIGTLDEIFEIFSMVQLGLCRKPIALYNVEGFFDGLVRYIDQIIAEGFLKPVYRDTLIVSDNLADIWAALDAFESQEE